MPAALLGRQRYEVPYPLVTPVRTFRTNKRRQGMPHIVGCHQVEYPAYPAAVHGIYSARSRQGGLKWRFLSGRSSEVRFP